MQSFNVLTTLSVLVLAFAFTRAQEPLVTDYPPGARPGDVPSGSGQDDKRGLWPMVNVDKNDNKSKVDVHVPIFFDMIKDNDDIKGSEKLDLSVMQGLVTVNRDKARDGKGQMSGPLTVTVFGIPVYAGTGVKPSSERTKLEDTLRSSRKELDNRVQSINSEANSNLESIRATLRQANERAMASMREVIGRLAGSLNRNKESSDYQPIATSQAFDSKPQRA